MLIKMVRKDILRYLNANIDGNQSFYNVASTALGNTLALRGNDGTIEVTTPYADSHAANKKYVDDIAATKQAVMSDLATIRSNASSGASKISATEQNISEYGFTKNIIIKNPVPLPFFHLSRFVIAS